MRASLIHELAARKGSSGRFDRREVLESVRKDLEDLLNERSICAGETADEEEAEPEPLASSVLCLGIPDPREVISGDLSRQELLRREMEGAIRRFEPRLRDVEVRVLDADEQTARTIVLEIRARLVTVGSTSDLEAAWRSVVEDGEARLEAQ